MMIEPTTKRSGKCSRTSLPRPQGRSAEPSLFESQTAALADLLFASFFATKDGASTPTSWCVPNISTGGFGLDMLRHIMTYLINVGINCGVFFLGGTYQYISCILFIFHSYFKCSKRNKFFRQVAFSAETFLDLGVQAPQDLMGAAGPWSLEPHGRSPTEPQRHPVTKWLRTVVAMARKKYGKHMGTWKPNH